MKINNSESCSSVKTTLNVIGGKWKPLIMFLLINEKLRFSELQRRISGITQKMLTEQLRELERDGLINRKVYPQVPPKVEYSITAYGRTLLPVLDTMHKWGKEHKKIIEEKQEKTEKIKKTTSQASL